MKKKLYNRGGKKTPVKKKSISNKLLNNVNISPSGVGLKVNKNIQLGPNSRLNMSANRPIISTGMNPGFLKGQSSANLNFNSRIGPGANLNLDMRIPQEGKPSYRGNFNMKMGKNFSGNIGANYSGGQLTPSANLTYRKRFNYGGLRRKYQAGGGMYENPVVNQNTSNIVFDQSDPRYLEQYEQNLEDTLAGQQGWQEKLRMSQQLEDQKVDQLRGALGKFSQLDQVKSGINKVQDFTKNLFGKGAGVGPQAQDLGNIVGGDAGKNLITGSTSAPNIIGQSAGAGGSGVIGGTGSSFSQEALMKSNPLMTPPPAASTAKSFLGTGKSFAETGVGGKLTGALKNPMLYTMGAQLAGKAISGAADDYDATTFTGKEKAGRMLSQAGNWASMGSALGPLGTLAGGIGGAIYGAASGKRMAREAKAQERQQQKQRGTALQSLAMAQGQSKEYSGYDLGTGYRSGGLWANIHAKRKRIKAGSGESMRKPGSKGAPTNQALKNSQMMGGLRMYRHGGSHDPNAPENNPQNNDPYGGLNVGMPNVGGDLSLTDASGNEVMATPEQQSFYEQQNEQMNQEYADAQTNNAKQKALDSYNRTNNTTVMKGFNRAADAGDATMLAGLATANPAATGYGGMISKGLKTGKWLGMEVASRMPWHKGEDWSDILADQRKNMAFSWAGGPLGKATQIAQGTKYIEPSMNAVKGLYNTVKSLKKADSLRTEYVQPAIAQAKENINNATQTPFTVPNMMKGLTGAAGLKDATALMKLGGTRNSYLKGGVAKPLPGGAVKFEGRSHEQGGILLDPVTEVEGGETMDKVNFGKGGKKDYFFSKFLKLGGRSFAERHEGMVKSGASQSEIDGLANMQEKISGRKKFNLGGERNLYKKGGYPFYSDTDSPSTPFYTTSHDPYGNEDDSVVYYYYDPNDVNSERTFTSKKEMNKHMESIGSSAPFHPNRGKPGESPVYNFKEDGYFIQNDGSETVEPTDDYQTILDGTDVSAMENRASLLADEYDNANSDRQSEIDIQLKQLEDAQDALQNPNIESDNTNTQTNAESSSGLYNNITPEMLKDYGQEMKDLSGYDDFDYKNPDHVMALQNSLIGGGSGEFGKYLSGTEGDYINPDGSKSVNKVGVDGKLGTDTFEALKQFKEARDDDDTIDFEDWEIEDEIEEDEEVEILDPNKDKDSDVNMDFKKPFPWHKVGTGLAMGLQMLPAIAAMRDKPDYMSPPGRMPKTQLDRVRFEDARAANQRDYRGMGRFIEQSGLGPGGIAAKMAAYSKKQAGDQATDAQEKRQNAAIANQEAGMDQRAAQINIANQMDVNKFNTGARAATKDRKLAGLDTLTKNFAGINKDLLAYKSQKDLATAIGGNTGVNQRFWEVEAAFKKANPNLQPGSTQYNNALTQYTAYHSQNTNNAVNEVNTQTNTDSDNARYGGVRRKSRKKLTKRKKQIYG